MLWIKEEIAPKEQFLPFSIIFFNMSKLDYLFICEIWII